MKNNESDYIFLAESENENENEENKDFDEDGYDRKDSDYSEFAALSKQNSLDHSWPQSYRYIPFHLLETNSEKYRKLTF